MSSRSEFDHYARNYSELLRGTLRDGFAQDGSFYHLRKWILITDFLRRHDLWRSDLRWLDVGCGKGEAPGQNPSPISPHTLRLHRLGQ